MPLGITHLFYIGIQTTGNTSVIVVNPNGGFCACQRQADSILWLCEPTVQSFQIEFKPGPGHFQDQPISPIASVAGPIDGSAQSQMTALLIDDGQKTGTLAAYYYSVSVVPVPGVSKPKALDPHILVNGGIIQGFPPIKHKKGKTR